MRSAPHDSASRNRMSAFRICLSTAPLPGGRARTAGKSYSSRSQDIRMMVWSRSGPTEMMLMGTPHTSSKYSMYLRVFSEMCIRDRNKLIDRRQHEQAPAEHHSA